MYTINSCDHTLYFVQQITLLAKQVVRKQVKPYDVLHFEISDSPLMQNMDEISHDRVPHSTVKILISL